MSSIRTQQKIAIIKLLPISKTYNNLNSTSIMKRTFERDQLALFLKNIDHCKNYLLIFIWSVITDFLFETINGFKFMLFPLVHKSNQCLFGFDSQLKYIIGDDMVSTLFQQKKIKTGCDPNIRNYVWVHEHIGDYSNISSNTDSYQIHTQLNDPQWLLLL